MENINFITSLSKYKVVYFHFLDGFIKQDVGDTLDNINNFLFNYKLVKNNIQILTIDYDLRSNDLLKTLNYRNIITNEITSYQIDFNKLNQINIDLLEKLKTLFNYCIYQVGHDKHATSFLVFIKNNKLYLLTINSGAGIENHNHIFDNNMKKMYCPYYGLELCDDIENSEKFKKAIIQLLNIFQIPHLYSLISNLQILITQDFEGYQTINLEIIGKILYNLMNCFNNLNINDFNIQIYFNKNKTRTTSIYSLTQILKMYINYEKMSFKLQYKNERIGAKGSNYYQLIINIFKKIIDTNIIKFSINNIISDLNKYNIPDLNIFKGGCKIEDLSIKKLIIHHKDSDIYIYDQESGSCSWFSIYWPIVLYNIFILNDRNKYIEQIVEINKKCYEIVLKIFSKQNFNLEKSNYPENIFYMKRLCNKFIDIKLLNKEILIDEIDFIYNNTFNSKINKITLFHDLYQDIEPITNQIDIFLKDVENKTEEDFLYSFIESNLQNSNIHKLNLQSKKLLNCYELFCKFNSIKTKKFIFPENKIPISLNIISVLITNIQKTHFSDKKIISKIQKININKYLNYADQFNETYNFQSISVHNIPNYLNDYIPIAFFLCKTYPSTNINLDYTFIQFTIFLHRFNLLLKIINEITNLVLSCLYNKQDSFYNKIDMDIIDFIGNTLFNIIIVKYFNISNNIKFNKDFFENLIKNEFGFGFKNNFKILDIDFKYLNNYYPKSKDYIKHLDTYYRSIDDNIIINNFFYQYPEYLYKTFDILNNIKPNSIDNIFIHLNLHYINDNIEIKDKLILYFLNYWFNTKEQFTEFIINNLLLLIYGCQGHQGNQYNQSKFDICTFIKRKYITIIPKDFHNFLLSILQNLSKEEFFKYILQEKDKILNKEILIKNTINKFISNVRYHPAPSKKYISVLQIESEIYFRINLENSLINYLFDSKDDTNIYLINRNIILTEQLNVNIECNLYIINKNRCIKFDAEFQKKEKYIYTFNIKCIKYNNNYVIPYSDINLPFKYVIPTNCFHFIYNVNNIFHITFFHSYIYRENKKLKNLLSDITLTTKTYDFTINPNNLFYFSKMNTSDFDNLVNICKHYGINKYNIIYVNSYNDATNYGYNFNEKCVELLDFNWNNIWNGKINDTINYKFINLSNKTDQNNLIDIEFQEIDAEFKRQYDNTSIKKLLNKIAKCQFSSDQNKRYKYISKLKYIKNRILDFFTAFIKVTKYANLNYLFTNYDYLYKYLLNVKIYNFIIKLEQEFDNIENLCSLIKINNELFDNKQTSFIYNFEILFEFITGNELLNEQMERYIQIINTFNNFENMKTSKYIQKNSNNIFNDYDNTYIKDFIKDNYQDPNYSIGDGLIDIKYMNSLNGGSAVDNTTEIKKIDDWIDKINFVKAEEIKKIDDWIDEINFDINSDEMLDKLDVKNIIKEFLYKFNFEPNQEQINNFISKYNGKITKDQIESYLNEFNTGEKIKKWLFNFSIKPGDYLVQNFLKENTDITRKQLEDYIKLHEENKYLYPLHHFMMGKGKSAILTPLLTIFFVFRGKNVNIIVPEHLKKQTKETMLYYLNIFRINDFVKIYSDSEIKKLFLNGEFSDSKKNSNIVFLIDEFDYILDPIKSNFNLVINKNKSTINLYKCIFTIILGFSLFQAEQRPITMENIINNHINFTKYEINDICKNIFSKDIENIYSQLQNCILKENINWGIHPTKCYAIPYRCKNQPLLMSNFSSPIITIFLTLYYYIILLNFKVDDYLTKFLINNQMINSVFKINIQDFLASTELINNLLINTSFELKIDIFDKIFTKIFNNLFLASEHYNTSFVDIINIDSIFKVGYSGTININLPNINSLYKFKTVIVDNDEKVNVNYAISKSEIIINSLEIINNVNTSFIQSFSQELLDNLNSYDAIIDTYGLFKNVKNEILANKLFYYFNDLGAIRDIVFLDEYDNKLVIINSEIKQYDENIKYNRPFIYYSQSHIIGIDIKQDNYPILKGLCIINENTTYTEVAQSIFRLRKINLGHSINFLYISNVLSITNNELIALLKSNDEQDKKSKYDYLVYQTIKSNFRKKRINPIDTKFMEKYKETIHYYYDEIIPEKSDDFFKGILKPSEIIQYKSFNFKLDRTKLLKLVYGIESKMIEEQLNQEQDSGQEKQTKIQVQIQLNETMQLHKYPPAFTFNYLDYLQFNNPHLDFSRISIRLNDLLSCLPNIFCNNNSYSYYLNKSGIALLYYEINDNQQFMIIPGYMVPYFIDNYLIFTLELNLINNKLIYTIDKQSKIFNDIKTKLLNENLIKILNNFEVHENHSLIDPIIILIGSLIICENKEKNIYQEKWLEQNNINFYNGSLLDNINSKLNEKNLLDLDIKWINKNDPSSIKLLFSNESYYNTIDPAIPIIKSMKLDITDGLYSYNYSLSALDLKIVSDPSKPVITQIHLPNQILHKKKYLKYKQKYLEYKLHF
jgi:hypothetical protein